MYVIAVVTPDTHTFKEFERTMAGTDLCFRHVWNQERCRGITFVGHVMLHDARDVKEFNKVMEMLKQRTINLKP